MGEEAFELGIGNAMAGAEGEIFAEEIMNCAEEGAFAEFVVRLPKDLGRATTS